LPNVVSDSGPLIHLAQINRLQILQKLFCSITVSPSVKVEVVDEGKRRGCPDAEAAEAAFFGGWVKVEPLSEEELKQAAKLADGEGISPADAQVILLAEKKKALFLSDDTALSKIAEMYGLKTWDTWNLLLEALSSNLITITEFAAAIDELGKKKFSLNEKQRQEILDAAQTIDKQSHS
jgi:uncharacterized protein